MGNTVGPPSPVMKLADELDALAEWSDRQLAGGAPSKWIVQVMVTGLRQCAAGIRAAYADRQAGQ